MTIEESHIILFSTDPQGDAVLTESLAAHFPDFSVETELKELCRHLIEPCPKVVLVAGDSMQETLTSYYRCLNAVSSHDICEHKVVSLIPRQDESQAYQAFRSGIIDEYLVARPLFELHRPTLICEHLLLELGVKLEGDSQKSYREGVSQYEHKVQKLVERGMEMKQHLKDSFQQSIEDIDRALTDAAGRIQANQPAQLDIDKLKETLAAIRSDDIRPELLRLQNKAVELLGTIVVDPKAGPDAADAASAKQPASTPKPKAKPKQPYVFNRLYQQDNIDADEILKQQMSRPSVLVVEDDPISLRLTQKLLESYQIKLEVATSGRSAFAALHNHAFHLVLMDITLPDTNGLYIVDQIGNHEGPNKETPIIMLSGNKNKATVKKAMEAGAKGYVIKPLCKAVLTKICSKFDIALKPKG